MKETARQGSGNKRRWRFDALVLATYGLVTAIMTWPAVTLLGRTYAEPRDPLGILWWFWWLRYSLVNRIPASTVTMVSVPFGLEASPYSVDPLRNLYARGLAVASSETVAYNLLLLASFFLTAVAMYLLARSLTGNRKAAAFCGLVYAFCPFMLTQGKEHPALVSAFWIPVVFLVLIRAWRKRTTGSIIACGAVFALVCCTNYHYGLFAGFAGSAFLVSLWLLGRPWKRKRIDWSLVWKAGAVLACVALVAVALLVVVSSSTQGESKSLEAVHQYSARPWDYVIPHAEGLLFGRFTGEFVVEHLHGSFLAENSLFLGYVPLLLAVSALVFVTRKRRRNEAMTAPGPMAAEDEDENEEPGRTPGAEDSDRATFFYNRERARIAWALAATSALAFLFSMPPSAKVLGFELYFPSYLLHRLLPQLRAYARFGIVIMFCVALLACYGIAVLMKSLKSRRNGTLLVLALCALILLEFTIVPPFYSLDTRARTGYFDWLEERPKGTVAAVYPLFESNDFTNYWYLFQQRLHQKGLVNGAPAGSKAGYYRESMLDISFPSTPGLLARLGADYVMLLTREYSDIRVPHPSYVFPINARGLDIPEGLEAVESFPECLVFEVTAEPAEFVPLFGKGFYEPFMDPQGRFWHPGVRDVEIVIESKMEGEATCDVVFEAMTARGTGQLVVRAGDGKAATVELDQSPVEVVLKSVAMSPGENSIVLGTDASPARLTEVPLYGDISAAMLIGDVLVERK